MDWEQRLRHQAFLSGARWGLLDAAIAPFVRQFAHVDAAWFAQQPWTGLVQWLRAFENSQAFAGVMHKEPVWTPNEKLDAAPRLTRFAPPF
jgi:glutathione S-transferase